jgi:hypothetical protein
LPKELSPAKDILNRPYQYSIDGKNWHDVHADNDKYCRWSKDGGISWVIVEMTQASKPKISNSGGGAAKGFLALFVLILAVVFLWNGCTGSSDSSKSTASKQPTDTDAYFMSWKFVKSNLKAPSTAKFPYSNQAEIIATGINQWKVTAYVDSENSFGAKIRTYYTATVRYIGNDEWELVNIKFFSP